MLQQKSHNRILETETGMFFEGNVDIVIPALYEKVRLIKEGKSHEHIRPLLLVLSGTMRGADGGGRVSAMQDMGVVDAFDTMVGISTGAAITSYTAANQARMGTSIYYEECVDMPLISVRRFLQGGHLADIHALANIFRTSPEKAIDQEALKRSRSDVFAIATNKETGEAELLNLKTLVDAVDAIEASIAIVGASDPVNVQGQEYIDGSLAAPFPHRDIIAQYNPTHIFVIVNGSVDDKLGPVHRLVARWMTRNLKHLRGNIAQWQVNFDKGLQDVRENASTTPYVIAWADKRLGSATLNAALLRTVATDSEAHMRALLTKYKK